MDRTDLSTDLDFIKVQRMAFGALRGYVPGAC